MSVRSLVFAGFLGASAIALAVANIHCSVLTTLAGDGGTDGGIGPGVDGGPVPGADGGGVGGLGTINVTIGCTGAGCGVAGPIIVEAKVCGQATVHKADNSQAGPLAEGTPVTVSLTDVPAGTQCVRAFIDANLSGSLNTGDVVGSPAETQVNVDPNTPAAVTITLNALQP